MRESEQNFSLKIVDQLNKIGHQCVVCGKKPTIRLEIDCNRSCTHYSINKIEYPLIFSKALDLNGLPMKIEVSDKVLSKIEGLESISIVVSCKCSYQAYFNIINSTFREYLIFKKYRICNKNNSTIISFCLIHQPNINVPYKPDLFYHKTEEQIDQIVEKYLLLS